MAFKLEDFDVAKFDATIKDGLSNGLGVAEPGKMCIEAAICYTLGLPHGDDPGCVSEAVRSFKIRLNDSNWSSPVARSLGLRDLGIAQLGSLGVINDVEFSRKLAEKTIKILIPKMLRLVFPDDNSILEAATLCEKKGTADAAANAAYAAYAAADSFLDLSASLALEVLRELGSPGCALLG